MVEQVKYDYELFVSYAKADEDWVKGYLLKTLDGASIQYIEESGFPLGAIKLKEFEFAIKQSKRTLLVISPEYLGEELEEFIRLMATTHDLDKQTSSVIPLIYKETSLPMSLGMLKGLRATTEKEQESAIVQLLADLERKVPKTKQLPCPYPGMRAFKIHEDKLFFGRDDEIKKLVARLEQHRFITVIGPSGSGKSSLVLAGLIPALKQGQLKEYSEWQIEIKRPVEDLQASLEKVLTQGEQTESNPLLFVVDQFEELFTIAKDKAQFCQENLLKLIAIPHIYVVLTVRADFYAELMISPIWSEIEDYRLEVVPLKGDKLRQVIKQPAENVKVFVDPALVQQLVMDMDAAEEKGVLPLLQETLRLSWKNLRVCFLPLSAYQSLLTRGDGQKTGLQVAIALVADQAIKDLKVEPEKQKAIARRIFLRLIQFGEGRPDTRRQQSSSSLRSSGDESELFDTTLEHLIQSRLLTAGEGKSQDKPVDIAHEALISGWPILQKWISERREAEQTRRRLENKAQEWLKLNKKGGLLDIVELEEVKLWLATSDATELGYDQSLRDLAIASQADIDEKEREKKEQEQRELDLIRDKLKLAILSSVDNLTASAEYAHKSGLDIEAIEKSIEAGKLLKDPSFDEDEIATKKMRILINLNQLVYGFRERNIFTGHTDQVWGLNFSPDDQKLVSTSADGSMRLWSLNDGELIQTIYLQYQRIKDAIFNRKGDLLISLIPSLKFKTIQSWNVNESDFFSSNKPLIPEDVFPKENQVRNIAFSPNNKIIAFDYGRQIKLWNFKEKPIDLLDGQDTHNDNINGLDFSPNSTILASAGGDGFIKVWDLNAKKLLKEWSLKDAIFSSVKFINNKTIVFSDIKGNIIIWDFLTNKEGRLVDEKNGDREDVNTLAVSPDLGRKFVVSGSRDGCIKIWDRKNSKYINGHNGSSLAINKVTFSNKNSQMLASAGADGLVKIWTIISPAIIDGWKFSFSPNSDQIVTGSHNDGSIKMWSKDFTLKKTLVNPNNRIKVFKVKFSPDGETIISTSSSKDKEGKKKGIIEIWASEGELKKTLPTIDIDSLPPASISFSPDSNTFIPVNRREKKVNIWELKDLVDGKPLENGKPLYTFLTSEYVQDVSFSPDATSIGVLVGKEIEIWSLTNGKESNPIRLKTPDENKMVAMSFSPDGATIAAAGTTGTVYFWNLHQISDQTKPHIVTKISKADNIVLVV